jgi:hypothetical protein
MQKSLQILRETDCMALWTWRGDRVRFDPQSGRLTHGGPEDAAVAVSLNLDRRGARLVWTGAQPPVCLVPASGDGKCAVVAAEDAQRLSLVEEPGGPLCLFLGEAALHALPDGTARLMEAPLSADAFFVAVSAHALRCAEALQADRWIDLADRRVYPPAAPVPGRPAWLAFAGRMFSIAGTQGPFADDAAPRSPLHRLHLVMQDGAMLHLARFRPLIYFTIYGGDSYYELLRLALRSLADHGAFDGTLCIAADRPRAAVRRLIPDSFAGRWLYRETTAEAGLFARFDCDQWGLEAYSPILYVDADVIVDAPLTPLLTLLAGSPRLHVGTSNHFVPHLAGLSHTAYASDIADWFGHWLFGNDPRLAQVPFAMGNSGTIGFATIADARLAFDLVRVLRRSVRHELVAYFGDQPLFNYALHALGCGDFTTLNRFIELARDAGECSGARRGLMHFHAGVGNVAVKLEAMLGYSASLASPPS